MNKNTKRGPGRPRFTMVYPTTATWTFNDLMKVNNVETDPSKPKRYGKSTLPKGDKNRCTKLTLTKNMDRDMFVFDENDKKTDRLRAGSLVVFTGEKVAPTGESGLGRKQFVYALREKFEGKAVNKATFVATKATAAPKASAPKATRKTRKARKTRTPAATSEAPAQRQTELSPATQQYEDIKSILAAPTPTVPAETPAPAATVPVVNITPAPAEPTPAPAPVANETTPVAAESANAKTATPVPTA